MQLSEQFATMPWGEPLLPPSEPPKVWANDIKKYYGGNVPPWFAYVHALPWLGHTMVEATSAPTCHLSPDLAAIVSLVVTQDNSCRHCYGVSRALLQLLGYREDHVLAIERDLETADLSRHDRAVLSWARRFSRASPRPLPAERAAMIDAGCTPGEVVETAFVAAMQVFANRVVTMLAVPAALLEQKVDGLLMRVLRPLIGRSIRRGGRARPMPPVDAPGPAAHLVAALGDSPGAGVVRRAVDRLVSANALPPRTNLLLAAVIGRALGCRTTVDQAGASLSELGLAPQDVEQVLANLGSPALSPLESVLVPFARETVSYRPEQLQERLREATRGLSREQVLELVGVTSLANALARLSVLLEQC